MLVCGPQADSAWYAQTRYGPNGEDVVTILAGIKAKLKESGADVVYAKGCDTVDPGWPETEVLPEPMSDKEKSEIDKAVEAAKGADVAIVVLGDGPKTTGESKSRTEP